MTPQSGEPRAAPRLLRLKVLALVIAAAVLLSWPMLILGAPLVFNDSGRYVRAGEAGVNLLLSTVFSSGGSASSVSASGAASEVQFIRSIPYSVFAYVAASTPLRLVGTTLLQASLVLYMVVALSGRAAEAPRRDITAAALVCALTTPLPWYGSYLMPDILAAAVVLYAAVLISSFDGLSTGERILLGVIATLATASHYGHMPLAAASTGAALAMRIAARRPKFGTAALAGAAPLAVTLIVNLVSSAAVLDSPSLAPRRLPVLLARSIEDGPARWHLEENCATERYAICEVFDEMPSSVQQALWGKNGIWKAATAEQFDRIRQEELVIIWRAFLEYPLRQSLSLARNVALQFVSIDADDFYPAQFAWDDPVRIRILDDARPDALLEGFGLLWAVTALGGAAAIAAMAYRDGLAFGREREIIAVVLFGLVANAAIFGGLSAPADRYQGRLIWIVPLLAALFWLERRRRVAERVRSKARALVG